MKKLLGAVFALVMVVASALGFAACSNSNDAETAQKAVNNLKVLYDQSKYYETSKDFEVLGEVSVNGTNYTVEWSVSSESGNVENYITFGTVDAESKMVKATVTLPETAIEYKLNAKVTVGKESATASFNRKLVAKPKDAAGTKDDPYSAAKVMEIANGMEPKTKFDENTDNPPRVYVEGYIVDVGTDQSPKYNRVGYVYIVDEYSSDKNKSSSDALMILSINYDADGPLTCFADLAVGKKIMVAGYIMLYQKNASSDPQPEITYFGDNGITCEYLEKVERTPEEKVELALSKVSATMTVTVAGDVELPESTVTGVTFTWSTTDTTYTVSENTLHVLALPTDEDKQITIKVTAACGTDASDTKDVTVTIKKAVVVEAGTVLLTKDILFPNLTSTYYSDYDGNHIVGSYTVTTSNVMGNTNNTLPVIQLKASGGSITLNGEFKSIVIVVETSFDTWDKPTVKVGGTEITPAIDDGVDTGIKNGSYTVMRYTLTYTITATGSQAIAITNEATHAIYAESITLSGATGGSTTPGGETHTHNYSYTTDTTAWQHTGTCTAEGECTAKTITEDCVPELNVCKCGHTYDKEEIVAKLFGLTESGSLKGTYVLEGTVTGTAAAGNSGDWKFDFIVDTGKTVSAYYVKHADFRTLPKEGDTVKVSGPLKLYINASGVKTYEFDGGNLIEVNGETSEPTDPNVIYSLNSDEQVSGSSNAYAGNCDVKCNGVTWNVEGNSQQQPWRFGGKSITGTDRKLTGKTAITGTVAKITLQLTDSGSITINSVTLKVYSSDPTADGAVAIATKNIEYQKDTEITITPDAGSEWTDCYYQIIFNVTVGNSNKYVSILKLEFSKAPAAAAASVETPVAILPGDEH